MKPRPPSSFSPLLFCSVLCGPVRPLLVSSLVLGDHHHHADAKQQRQDLHEGLAEAGAASQQLGQHGHRGDVDEAAGGEGQDPGGGGRADALRQQRAGGAGQSAQCRQQLQEDGLRAATAGILGATLKLKLIYLVSFAASYLPLGATGLDEDGKVSDLVRHLVQQDGEGGDGADGGAHQEGRAHGQAVGEVVDEVSR